MFVQAAKLPQHLFFHQVIWHPDHFGLPAVSGKQF
jgi:hypothetical protein